MKIINIIFDFDGVLAESLEIKSHAFKKMYINYGEKFAENVVDHHKKMVGCLDLKNSNYIMGNGSIKNYPKK